MARRRKVKCAWPVLGAEDVDDRAHLRETRWNGIVLEEVAEIIAVRGGPGRVHGRRAKSRGEREESAGRKFRRRNGGERWARRVRAVDVVESRRPIHAVGRA